MGRSEDLFERFREGGKKAIQKCIDDGISEDLFLDYKEYRPQSKPGDFGNDAQNHLSKAISGFANSAGGVLVWGVRCRNERRGDVPTELVPIQNVRVFRSNLEGWISGLTLPAHDGVESATIMDGRTKNGFVVTHIPQSSYAPLRSLKKDNYYIRAGSSFAITPHDVLAGMFGRRPLPKLDTDFRPVMPVVSRNGDVTFKCEVVFRNVGVSIIRDLYITSRTISVPGDKDGFHLAVGPGDGWKMIGNMRHQATIVSRPDFSLVPGASVVGATLSLYREGPIQGAFEIEINYGCENGQVHALKIDVGPPLFKRIMTDLMPMRNFETLQFQFDGESEALIAMGQRIDKYSQALWIPGSPLPD